MELISHVYQLRQHTVLIDNIADDAMGPECCCPPLPLGSSIDRIPAIFGFSFLCFLLLFDEFFVRTSSK